MQVHVNYVGVLTANFIILVQLTAETRINTQRSEPSSTTSSSLANSSSFPISAFESAATSITVAITANATDRATTTGPGSEITEAEASTSSGKGAFRE